MTSPDPALGRQGLHFSSSWSVSRFQPLSSCSLSRFIKPWCARERAWKAGNGTGSRNNSFGDSFARRTSSSTRNLALCKETTICFHSPPERARSSETRTYRSSPHTAITGLMENYRITRLRCRHGGASPSLMRLHLFRGCGRSVARERGTPSYSVTWTQ